jgi:hypothetical protein
MLTTALRINMADWLAAYAYVRAGVTVRVAACLAACHRIGAGLTRALDCFGVRYLGLPIGKKPVYVAGCWTHLVAGPTWDVWECTSARASSGARTCPASPASFSRAACSIPRRAPPPVWPSPVFAWPSPASTYSTISVIGDSTCTFRKSVPWPCGAPSRPHPSQPRHHTV